MAGFEALSQVLLACQSPALIAVLFVWVLICSSELWLALAEIWQRWAAEKTISTHKTPVATFDVFNSFVALVLLILSVLPDRCQHESVGVTASIILNFGSYALGPLKMDIFEALCSPVCVQRRTYLTSISVVTFLALVSRLTCALFECFPEYDKEYKWRLGLTIVAAVLTHSSSILAGATMIRFWNETLWMEEGDPIEQDGGSSHVELDNRSEAQPSNISEVQQVKWTIMYKTGLGIATVFLSVTLTGCFYRNAQFPVVRCICAHSAVVTILRMKRKVARWWRERAQAPQRNGMMFAVVVEKLNAIIMERRWGFCFNQL